MVSTGHSRKKWLITLQPEGVTQSTTPFLFCLIELEKKNSFKFPLGPIFYLCKFLVSTEHPRKKWLLTLQPERVTKRTSPFLFLSHRNRVKNSFKFPLGPIFKLFKFFVTTCHPCKKWLITLYLEEVMQPTTLFLFCPFELESPGNTLAFCTR